MWGHAMRVTIGRLTQGALRAHEMHSLNSRARPQEVLFVKVKGFLLDLRWTTAKEAATLDRWMHAQVLVRV